MEVVSVEQDFNTIYSPHERKMYIGTYSVKLLKKFDTAGAIFHMLGVRARRFKTLLSLWKVSTRRLYYSLSRVPERVLPWFLHEDLFLQSLCAWKVCHDKEVLKRLWLISYTGFRRIGERYQLGLNLASTVALAKIFAYYLSEHVEIEDVFSVPEDADAFLFLFTRKQARRAVKKVVNLFPRLEKKEQEYLPKGNREGELESLAEEVLEALGISARLKVYSFRADYGFCIYREGLIYVGSELNKTERLIVFLHELSHLIRYRYFKSFNVDRFSGFWRYFREVIDRTWKRCGEAVYLYFFIPEEIVTSMISSLITRGLFPEVFKVEESVYKSWAEELLLSPKSTSLAKEYTVLADSTMTSYMYAGHIAATASRKSIYDLLDIAKDIASISCDIISSCVNETDI